MKRVISLASVLAVLVACLQLIVLPARAQDPIQDALNGCAKEIKTYCSAVAPGDGRLVACMKAHEDKLSDGCIYALNRADYLVKRLAISVKYVFEQCRADAVKLCPDVKVGEGRVIACLAKQKDKVGKACTTALADVTN